MTGRLTPGQARRLLDLVVRAVATARAQGAALNDPADVFLPAHDKAGEAMSAVVFAVIDLQQEAMPRPPKADPPLPATLSEIDSAAVDFGSWRVLVDADPAGGVS